MINKYKLDTDGYKNYGYLAAVDPQYSIFMKCENCKTKWTGCWDEFQCPECEDGELPSFDLNNIYKELNESTKSPW